jgi:hypothetical protein
MKKAGSTLSRPEKRTLKKKHFILSRQSFTISPFTIHEISPSIHFLNLNLGEKWRSVKVEK